MGSTSRALMDYYVLDALADDIESLQQIVPAVKRAADMWQGEISPDDVDRMAVLPGILRLLRDDCISALGAAPSGKELLELPRGQILDASLDDYWFRLTLKGRMIHSTWDPPPERPPVGNRSPAV